MWMSSFSSTICWKYSVVLPLFLCQRSVCYIRWNNIWALYSVPLLSLSLLLPLPDCFCLFVCLFVFLGTHVWHMEVPRLRVKSELQLPACATATAVQDLSCFCYLHHSSWQTWFFNSLSKARDWTHILMHTSWVHYHWATIGTPSFFKLKKIFFLFF